MNFQSDSQDRLTDHVNAKQKLLRQYKLNYYDFNKQKNPKYSHRPLMIKHRFLQFKVTLSRMWGNSNRK